MVSTGPGFQTKGADIDCFIEWYEFSFKDKYSGEVYLELTFYSNVS